jgi:magnesium-transporting ATPase (P-type)
MNQSIVGRIAFVGRLDPHDCAGHQAIQALSQYGVKVKVSTEDNSRVTRKTCREFGLGVKKLILGSQIEGMTDEQLAQSVANVTVFAKLTPAQKERIVHALHRNDHVVGFMGNSINDATALRAADVGVSIDNAVDVSQGVSRYYLPGKKFTRAGRRRAWGKFLLAVSFNAACPASHTEFTFRSLSNFNPVR